MGEEAKSGRCGCDYRGFMTCMLRKVSGMLAR
jgi:hypothetical protein